MLGGSLVRLVMVELGCWSGITAVTFVIALVRPKRNKPPEKPEYLEGPPFGNREDEP